MTSGASVLLLVGEPFSLDQKELILQRIEAGLKSLNNDIAGCDVNTELDRIAAENLPSEEGVNGERVIKSEDGPTNPLAVNIIINPQLWTVQAHLREFLKSGAKHRHIVYSGQVLQGCGSWVLQDDTFPFASFASILREVDVENSLKQQEGSSLHLHTFAEGSWSLANIQKIIPNNVTVELNPDQKLESEQGVMSLSTFIGNKITVKTPKDLLLSSDVVGNIRFNRPTLYVFPGCNGDSALFGINGFNLLVNGGYNRKACFWDFTRHLDRIDAMLVTHLGSDNIFGLSTVMDRKVTENVHPEIGYVYMNGVEKKKHSPNGDTHPENGGLHKQTSLMVNLAEEGHRVIENLHLLGQAPGSCIGSMQGKEFKPINLYQKVGHGSLDMYVLNPMQDSKELKEFYTQWNKNVNNFTSKGGIPLPNMMSVCALLVWRPANVNEKITRILFPGNAPQPKIFEGLDKLKALDIFQHSSCSQLSLNAPKPTKKAAAAKPASASAKRASTPSAARAEPKKTTPPPPEKKSPTKSAPPPSKTNKDAKNKKAGAGTAAKTAKKSPPSASPSSVEAKSPVEPAKPIVPEAAKVVEAPVPDVPEVKAEAPVVEKPVERPPEPTPAWEAEAPKAPEPAPVVEEPPQLVDIPQVESVPEPVAPIAEPASAEPPVPESPKQEEPAPVPSPQEPLLPEPVAEPIPVTKAEEPAEESVPEPSIQSEQIGGDQALPPPAEPLALPDPVPEQVPLVPEAPEPVKPDSPVEKEPLVDVPAPVEAAPEPEEPAALAVESDTVEADQLLQNVEDDPPMGVPEPLPDPNQFDSATYAAFAETSGALIVDIVQSAKEEENVEQDDEPNAEKDITPTSEAQYEEMVEEVIKDSPVESIEAVVQESPAPPEEEFQQPEVAPASVEATQVNDLVNGIIDQPTKEEKQPEVEVVAENADVEAVQESPVSSPPPEVPNYEMDAPRSPVAEEVEPIPEPQSPAGDISEESPVDDTPSPIEDKSSPVEDAPVSAEQQGDIDDVTRPEEAPELMRAEEVAPVSSEIPEHEETQVTEGGASPVAESEEKKPLSPAPSPVEESFHVQESTIVEETKITEDIPSEESPAPQETEKPAEDPEPVENPVSDEPKEIDDVEAAEEQASKVSTPDTEPAVDIQMPEATESLKESPEPVDEPPAETAGASGVVENSAPREESSNLIGDEYSASEDLSKATFESGPLDLEHEGDIDEESLIEMGQPDRSSFDCQAGQPDLLSGMSADSGAGFALDSSQELPPLDCGSTTNPFLGVIDSEVANTAALEEASHIPQSNSQIEMNGTEPGKADGIPAAQPQDLERDSLEREDPGSSFDPLKDWGQPMGLPAPDDGNPKAAKKPGAVNGAKKTGTTKPAARAAPGSGTAGRTPADAKKPASADARKTAKSTSRKPPVGKAKDEAPKKPASSAATRRPASGGPGSGSSAAPQAGTKTATSRGPAAKRASMGTARGASATKAAAPKPVTPFYLDLTYVPNHGDASYSDVDFFRRVRARYYVLSALNPNPAILNSFLEAKESWEDAEAEVTIIPTYDTEVLRHWMALHREKLGQLKVDVAPSASRCTIQLQDHETSCAAYRLEF